MITPKPTERLKKICPAAASHVCGLLSVSNDGFHIWPRPFHTLCSGCAASGAPSVSTRASTTSAQTAIRGIAQLQNFSMPLLMPR